MKKVLIITYYWPPSGGPGVQRWLKFVKYLPQYGWKPIVVVPENPEYPVLDNSLLNDIPEEAEIIKLPIWEPYNIFKKLTGRNKNEKVNNGLFFDERNLTKIEKISLWIRGNILVPDPRIFWVRPAVRRLKKMFPDINPDIIITTGPPHSVHLIGLGLKKAHKDLNWISDLRDPWSDIYMLNNFFASKYSLSRQRALEKKVLDNASLITTVSPSWANKLQNKTITQVRCITNGFDEKDFIKLDKEINTNNFVICHAGLINSYRNHKLLWEVLENLCEKHEGFKEKLKVHLIGTIDSFVKQNLDKLPNLKSRTRIIGYIDHSELLVKYEEASCLLLLLNNNRNSVGHIPGKYFEYLGAKKAILAIGPVDSDLSQIINSTNSGHICDFNDSKAMEQAILNLYTNRNSLNIRQDEISKYSRNNLTKRLSDEMHKLIS